jgi:small subunit ribosomal protein S8
MSKDVIGDFLTIIRNGIMRSKLFVTAPYSRMKHAIAENLKQEGFISDVTIEGEGIEKSLKIILKYVDGESVIHELDRYSRPGRRIYTAAKHIKPVVGKMGISILTTSKGVITDKKARELGLGGEVLCTVW